MSVSKRRRGGSADGDLHPRLLQCRSELCPGWQVERFGLPFTPPDLDPHDAVAIGVGQGVAGIGPGQRAAASVDADNLVLGPLVGDVAEGLLDGGNECRWLAGIAFSFQARESRG